MNLQSDKEWVSYRQEGQLENFLSYQIQEGRKNEAVICGRP